MKFDVSHDIFDLISKIISLAESCKQDLGPRLIHKNNWRIERKKIRVDSFKKDVDISGW